MTRDQLEHIIRADANVTGEREFIVIGSQAILGQIPNAPEPLLISKEADLYARHPPDLSDHIDGNLGEESQFDRTFKYHADGVSPTTATLPEGWGQRLTKIQNANTRGAIGWCLDVHDIAIAKYVAGREKDKRYNRDLWAAGFLHPATIADRLATTELDDERRQRIASAIEHDQRMHHSTVTAGAPRPATTPGPDLKIHKRARDAVRKAFDRKREQQRQTPASTRRVGKDNSQDR